MATGTFPKIGTGTADDPFRPDLSSLESATVKAKFLRLFSETPTEMTCDYKLLSLVDGDTDLLRNQIKNSALFNDATWAGLTSAQKADFIRTVCQRIVKYLLRGAP